MTAQALADRDPRLRIAVFTGPGSGGASASSGAMIAPFTELTAAGLREPDHAERLQYARRAAALWRDHLARFDDGDLITSDGVVLIANTVSTDLADHNYRAIKSALRAETADFEQLDPAELGRGVSPAWHARPTEAILVHEEYAFDARAAFALMTGNWTSRCNIRLVQACAKLRHESPSSAPDVIDDTGQVHSAGAVVVAAGAWTRDLFPDDDRRLLPPVFSGVGMALLVAQPAVPIPLAVRTPNESFACGLHAVPQRDGLLYLGETSQLAVHPALHAPLGAIEHLARSSVRQLSTRLAETRHLGTLTGNRPVSLDLDPVIGRTALANVHVATGTGREGLALSPVIGEYLAGQVLAGHGNDIKLWDPQRPPQQAWTAEAAAAEVVRNTMCSFAEKEGKFAFAGWYEQAPRVLAAHAEQVYENLPAGFVIEPALCDLYLRDPESMTPILDEYLQAWGWHR
ncbi:hypothetical protein GCM10009565_51850 [Amycolatopsis albidoflavus]